MRKLSKDEFMAAFESPMIPIVDQKPPCDFWPYFDQIPKQDFNEVDCSEGVVGNVWNNASNKFQHILINSDQSNVFMVIVLDLLNRRVHGHRLLDLSCEYSLGENSQS